MRLKGIVSIFGVICLLCVTGYFQSARANDDLSAPSPYPSVKMPNNPKLAKQIKKGKYLVTMSDCLACHTAKGGKPFAGGHPVKTPFGTIYSTNITPDKKTGIGKWSFAQFDEAVRYGDSPHGYLFAAMPYINYNVFSKQQAHDMWEYLKRVPAVDRKNKPIQMPPPFKWRWLQFGWRFLFFKPSEDTFKPNPNKSALWNRGQFIVKGPEHCSDCHTPHNFLGGTEKRYFLTGSDITGFWAPNITSAAVGPHPIKTIMDVFKTGHGLAGGKLKGPMMDAIQHSMRFLTPRDMRAIAVYLKSVVSAEPPGPRPVSPNRVDLKLGHTIFEKHCSACHMSGVGGAPKVGDVADWKPLEKTPLYILYENVWHGVSIMPAKGGCSQCSSRDITSAITYMLKTSQPGKKATSSGKKAGASGKIATHTVSLSIGKQIFQQHCSACHASGALGAPVYGNKKDWAPRIKLGLTALYKHALNGIKQMPPKGGCSGCSTDQIKSAVDYMVAGSGGKSLVKHQH